jgi:hypothetical protein
MKIAAEKVTSAGMTVWIYVYMYIYTFLYMYICVYELMSIVCYSFIC